MRVEVVVPELGLEPEAELVVSMWFAELGEEVLEGDRLVELLAGAFTFDVQAPATGRLVEINYYEDDPVRCGDVLGVVESIEEGYPEVPPPREPQRQTLPEPAEPEEGEEFELEELELEESEE